jgi:hypothetical protein
MQASNPGRCTRVKPSRSCATVTLLTCFKFTMTVDVMSSVVSPTHADGEIVASTRLKIKTVVLARNTYNIVSVHDNHLFGVTEF